MKKLFRAWFYIRRGHNIYLAYLLSVMNFMTIQYKLLIEKFHIFPSFRYFIILFIPTYILLALTIGILDRRKKILATDQEIFATENPVLREILNRLDAIEKSLKQS